jgi:hypothetical protein
MALSQNIFSLDQNLKMIFSIENGIPTYQLQYKGQKIIERSKLQIEFENASMTDNIEMITSFVSSEDSVWKPVLGEVAEIQNRYNELKVELIQKDSQTKYNIVFRLFDEGLAFRYEFPQQEKLNYFVINQELTQFNLTGDHKTFWIPGDPDSQEYVYNETKLSEIDNSKLDLSNGIALKSIFGDNFVQSPLMMKSADGLYINIFEAAVDNYPVMHLKVDTANFDLTSQLVPNAIGKMAYLQTTAHTPWRTIMVSDDAKNILSSKMILNLNEPSKLDDTSWIKPMKYVGIWWEMHIGKSTWDYAGSQNALNAADGQLQPSVKHGATTENTMKYIDFAAKHGFDGVLVEGWNVGWEDWFGNWKENVFDFTTPYPDFDIQKVTDYAKSKGIKMIMHHETSGSVSNYERHLDRAFNLMKKYGYPAVKTGYVGRIIPRGEFHDGQSMVNHFHYVVRRAADQQLMINSHESSRPTGMHRTYPNYIAAEAARGNEFNGWSNGNPPMHETILPFTRFLGGPMDYTPGIFKIKPYEGTERKEQVHTTLAKQLALYVSIYSPLQMAADLPENYEQHLDAFQFIKDVAVDWQNSIYLEAEPGDYITVARKEKNGERWFLGAITDENPRKTKIKLDFLTPNVTYEATIYQDAKDTHWQNNPTAYEIKRIKVNANSTLDFNLVSGGGTAVSFKPIIK